MAKEITLDKLIGRFYEYLSLKDIKVILEDNQSVCCDLNNNAITFKENEPKAYVRLGEHKLVVNENDQLKANFDYLKTNSTEKIKDLIKRVNDLEKENERLRNMNATAEINLRHHENKIMKLRNAYEDLHKQLVVEQSLSRIAESTYGLVNGTGKGKPIGITNDQELEWEAFKAAVMSIDPLKTFNDYFNGYKECQSSKFGVPKIKKVMFRDPATIVFWKDGTKTVVKAHNEQYDPEKGLAMAISKKALGNDRGYYETFQRYLPKVKEKKQCQYNKTGVTAPDGCSLCLKNGGFVTPDYCDKCSDKIDIASMYAVAKKKE